MPSPHRQVHSTVPRPRCPYPIFSSRWVCPCLHPSSSHVPCFSCRGNPCTCLGQAPCSLHQLLQMHDWEARTLGRVGVVKVKITKSDSWDAGKKQAKVIQLSEHWYLVSFSIMYSIEDTRQAGMTRSYGWPMHFRKGSWSPGSIH